MVDSVQRGISSGLGKKETWWANAPSFRDPVELSFGGLPEFFRFRTMRPSGIEADETVQFEDCHGNGLWIVKAHPLPQMRFAATRFVLDEKAVADSSLNRAERIWFSVAYHGAPAIHVDHLQRASLLKHVKRALLNHLGDQLRDATDLDELMQGLRQTDVERLWAWTQRATLGPKKIGSAHCLRALAWLSAPVRSEEDLAAAG